MTRDFLLILELPPKTPGGNSSIPKRSTQIASRNIPGLLINISIVVRVLSIILLFSNVEDIHTVFPRPINFRLIIN